MRDDIYTRTRDGRPFQQLTDEWLAELKEEHHKPRVDEWGITEHCIECCFCVTDADSCWPCLAALLIAEVEARREATR